MCSIKEDQNPIDKITLEHLYQRKCVQIERAKASANEVMYALYKAEAELLKTELNKF